MPEHSDHQNGPTGPCAHCGSGRQRGDGDVFRCVCGSLLARLVLGGVELKCRRCKRTVVIPFSVEESSTAG